MKTEGNLNRAALEIGRNMKKKKKETDSKLQQQQQQQHTRSGCRRDVARWKGGNHSVSPAGVRRRQAAEG